MLRMIWFKITTYDGVANHDDLARYWREQERQMASDVESFLRGCNDDREED